MIFEATTHYGYPICQERRGHGISFVSLVATAIEGEVQRFEAVDAAAVGQAITLGPGKALLRSHSTPAFSLLSTGPGGWAPIL